MATHKRVLHQNLTLFIDNNYFPIQLNLSSSFIKTPMSKSLLRNLIAHRVEKYLWYFCKNIAYEQISTLHRFYFSYSEVFRSTHIVPGHSSFSIKTYIILPGIRNSGYGSSAFILCYLEFEFVLIPVIGNEVAAPDACDAL